MQDYRKTKAALAPGKDQPEGKVEEHPFFGMWKGGASVEEEMDRLRGRRPRVWDSPG